MRWKKTVTVYGAHAEGEIGRVVTGGTLDVPGATMIDKLNWLNTEGDEFRRFCLFEPRGAAQMNVNMLTSACSSTGHAGFVPMLADGCHPMSGSNAMCVATVLLETGMVKMQEPETTVRLDTAAGLITATAACKDGRAESIALDFFPSFAERIDVEIDVPDVGKVIVDVAFGGMFYVLVDAQQFGLKISPENSRKLVEIGNKVKAAAQDQIEVQHPVISQFNSIEFCMFTDVEDFENKVLRNATIIPPGRFDRSPCGTGTAARLSVMHRRGIIDVGEDVTMLSAIGSRFQAKISDTILVGDKNAVVTKIEGRAWIFAIHQLGVDPTDIFPTGFTMADTWGDGMEHIVPEL